MVEEYKSTRQIIRDLLKSRGIKNHTEKTLEDLRYHLSLAKSRASKKQLEHSIEYAIKKDKEADEKGMCQVGDYMDLIDEIKTREISEEYTEAQRMERLTGIENIVQRFFDASGINWRDRVSPVS